MSNAFSEFIEGVEGIPDHHRESSEIVTRIEDNRRH